MAVIGLIFKGGDSVIRPDMITTDWEDEEDAEAFYDSYSDYSQEEWDELDLFGNGSGFEYDGEGLYEDDPDLPF